MIWHPSEQDLALARSGDLPQWKRSLVARHLERCSACAEKAAGYAEFIAELRAAAAEHEEPFGLASRILASAQAAAGQAAPVRWQWAAVTAAWALLVVAGVAIIGSRQMVQREAELVEPSIALPRTPAIEQPTQPPPPIARAALAPDAGAAGEGFRASVTSDAVVSEVTGPRGRHRVVLYTAAHGGRAEISAFAGGIGVTRADPQTGVVTITRISLGE